MLDRRPLFMSSSWLMPVAMARPHRQDLNRFACTRQTERCPDHGKGHRLREEGRKGMDKRAVLSLSHPTCQFAISFLSLSLFLGCGSFTRSFLLSRVSAYHCSSLFSTPIDVGLRHVDGIFFSLPSFDLSSLALTVHCAVINNNIPLPPFSFLSSLLQIQPSSPPSPHHIPFQPWKPFRSRVCYCLSVYYPRSTSLIQEQARFYRNKLASVVAFDVCQPVLGSQLAAGTSNGS